MIRVLALDIASTTGVCHDDPKYPNVPFFRTFELRGAGGAGEFGPRFAALHTRLDVLLDAMIRHNWKPDVVAFEEPLNVRRRQSKMSNSTTRLLVGLAAVAECLANIHGIKCYEVNVSTAKAHFGGRTTDDDPKAAVMARCKQLGWHVKNDNEGDAGALWSYTKCMLDPKFSYQTTPLFGRSA